MSALVVAFLLLLVVLGVSNKEVGKFLLASAWAVMVIVAAGSFVLGIFIPTFR